MEREAVVAKNATTAADGKTYQVEYYNLDAIISVGYRVNSSRATRFRQWATRVLSEHLTQGYSLNEHRLAQQGLTALTLLIAESDPKSKELMVRLTMNLIAESS
ncbi:RhuM family protein [Alcaligenes sp. SDU_A2]|uniref:RhuM family protein n=1 Tax=Alcaligenes sp. SDU_A2 TaxID=3136634 RepID=UPI00311DC229